MTDLWRDMDFALPAGHPSTWEQECKQLRVKLQEAESAANWSDMTKNRAIEETKQLRARVTKLEAALKWYGHQAALMGKITIDADWALKAMKADGGEKARAALRKQEGGQ